MDEREFRRVRGTLRTFHRRFAPLFGRTETRQRSAQYLRGLLVQQTDRRNAENLAEAVDGATPRALQRFLTAAPWSPDLVTAAVQRYLGERLGPADDTDGTREVARDGVWSVDGTGFPKQGTHSVGVARQYCGTLGKVGNCQVGVFLGYASGRGHALVDGELLLPRTWLADPARCAAAGVPEAVTALGYRSQVDLALALLRRARTIGALVGQWVTGDEAFGQDPVFRDALDADAWQYVLEVPRTTLLFTRPARTRLVRLGPGTAQRPVTVLPAALPAQAVAATLPAREWHTLTVAVGAQGPRTHQFAAVWGWECRDDAPGRRTWLLLRRNLDGSEAKYFFANAPRATLLQELARVSAQRWPIETEFQQGKGEVGLDEYEVRSWRGWHHHITMALLAIAFLLTLEQDWGEKDARRHAAASDPRVARGVAPPPLDRPRPASLADRYPVPQRPRDRVPRQTASPYAA